jgi:hypothetical protein
MMMIIEDNSILSQLLLPPSSSSQFTLLALNIRTHTYTDAHASDSTPYRSLMRIEHLVVWRSKYHQ